MITCIASFLSIDNTYILFLVSLRNKDVLTWVEQWLLDAMKAQFRNSVTDDEITVLIPEDVDVNDGDDVQNDDLTTDDEDDDDTGDDGDL